MNGRKKMSIAKLHLLFIIPIAMVNLIGIFSSTLYDGMFVFFVISILNIVTIASIVVNLLKNNDVAMNRKLSFINLGIMIALFMGTFFKHIYLLAS